MKIAVVTGAASGIGSDCCNDLLLHGWTVYALDRSQKALDNSATQFRQAGGRFVPMLCDVSNGVDVTRSFAAIRKQVPVLHAVICSAGIFRAGPLLEMAEPDFDALFAVNTKGAWLTARAALLLLKAGAGDGAPARIIFVASIAAIRPKVGGGAYAASKVALTQMARVLAVELAPMGILVNAVAPATVDTPMTRQLNADAGKNNYKLSGVSPLGRVAAVADVTSVIRFLLSNDANYLAGTILPVDGGTSAAFDPN